MLSTFFRKTVKIFQESFVSIFGKDDSRQNSLHKLEISSWQSIANLRTSENGIIHIFYYENRLVKDALYYIKNKKDEILAKSLCTILADILLPELGDKEIFEGFENPLIIGIPSGNSQENKRGFNPSEFIAVTLGKILNIEYKEGILKKIKQTIPQKTLKREKRLLNVKNSMELCKSFESLIKDRAIIIVDDITTTGATFIEAKRALKMAGAKKVLCIALAH